MSLLLPEELRTIVGEVLVQLQPGAWQHTADLLHDLNCRGFEDLDILRALLFLFANGQVRTRASGTCALEWARPEGDVEGITGLVARPGS